MTIRLNIIFSSILLGIILMTLSCSTIKSLKEEQLKLEISDFKITDKGETLAIYQLKATLINHTKEPAQLLLPLAESSTNPYDWHKPEFFMIQSNPEIGPMFIDQFADGAHIVKTPQNVTKLQPGKSLDFVFNSNCSTENNMQVDFKGTTTLVLHYEVTPQKKEYWLSKLPKDATIRSIIEQLPDRSIKSNSLEINISE